jgi:hypothetical protein
MKWDGVTPAQYEAVRKLTNWEGNVPKGAVFHACGFTKSGMRVTDIWESPEDFNSFVESRLMPAVKQIGIVGEPKVKLLPLHHIFTPDLNLLKQ